MGYCLDSGKARKVVLNRRGRWTLANRVTTVHRLHVIFRTMSFSWVWWPTPLILSLKRHRQAVLYEFESDLVYKEDSRPARAT